MNIYAVKDEIIGFTGSIMTARNDEEVTRWFDTIINDTEENQMSKWYKDYSIWCVGNLDKITGEITSQQPKLVVRGDMVKRLTREPVTLTTAVKEE